MCCSKLRELQARLCHLTFYILLNSFVTITHRHGNCDIPHQYPKNQPLAHWVTKQRQQYKLFTREYIRAGGGGNCQLTEERVLALEEIGFDWKYTPLGNSSKAGKKKKKSSPASVKGETPVVSQPNKKRKRENELDEKESGAEPDVKGSALKDCDDSTGEGATTASASAVEA